MCSRKSHAVSVQHFLHGDNWQGCLLYRSYGSGLVLGMSFWRGQLTESCPVYYDKPSVYLQFWCLNVRQVPHVCSLTTYHSPDLFDDGFIALLIVTAGQNRQAYLYETPQSSNGARPSFSCLGRSKDAKTSGTRNYSTPRIDINRIKY